MKEKSSLADVHEVRTCILCRTRDLKKNLTRITMKGNFIVVDDGKKMRGRGAHLHMSCMKHDAMALKMVTKGFLSKVFKKKNFEGDTSALEALSEQLKERMSQQ